MSHVDVHSDKGDKHTHIYQTVLLSGLIECSLSQSTSHSPTQSEIKWDVLPLSWYCAHMYVSSLQIATMYKFMFLLQNNRCVVGF